MDAVVKTTVEVMEGQRRVIEKESGERGVDDSYSSSHSGGDATSSDHLDTHQLTRFYKKLLHLQPKNLVQLVFELTYLYLATNQLQAAWDHLSNWIQSHQFTHERTGDALALQYAQGLLGVIAWECSKRASFEAKFWQEKIQRRQEGESDEEVDSIDMEERRNRESSHTLSRAHAQSTSDLHVEFRTSTQKASAFEKLARQKLKSALISDPKNEVWLWYYLECLDEFYRNALPTEIGTVQPGASAAATIAAAQARVQASRAKLAVLQQRLLRKIDEHLVAAPRSTAGWTMKLHCLSHFSSSSPILTSSHCLLSYLAARHLLALDPMSNAALEKVWRAWRDQGERQRTQGEDGGEGLSSSWSIRAVEVLDIIAGRLDVYPGENWSWQVMARLLVHILGIEKTSVEGWQLEALPSAGVDEIASVPSTPILAAAAAIPPTRSDSITSASPTNSQASTPRKKGPQKLEFPMAESPGRPVQQQELPPPSPAHLGVGPSAVASLALAPQRSESILSGASSLDASLSSSKLGDLETKPPSSSFKSFPHNALSSLPSLSDAERQAKWLGRIEWWVQANGWWRGVKQMRIEELPTELPVPAKAKNLILRGACYSLVLQWMGWIR